MSNVAMLKCKGLYTFANYLSNVPEGALLDATNVVIDRDGIIEPRRGIKQYGTFGSSLDTAKQLLNYKNKVLVHYASKLAYDNGSGTITDFSGTFTAVDSTVRIKGVELNSNFYVTTDSGIKKIASNSNDLSTATVTNAGGIKALDGSAVVDYTAPGFFSGLSKVAYRIVWGTTDINNNLILGVPSSRIVVTNSDTNSGTVTLTFNVPTEINTNYFYQIYRTAIITAGSLTILDTIDPGDEMKLVIEDAYVSGNTITVTDIAPDSFQEGGTPLYTNPVSGDGINQANERPPVAKDVAIFKNSIFYANTRTRHNFSLNLLGLGGMHSGNISNLVDHTSFTTITSNGHGLVTGDKVTIVGTGASAIDNAPYLTVTRIDNNTFTVPVSGAGGATNTGTFYSSYLTITNGTSTNLYFFVGRAQVTSLTFDTQANTVDGSWFKLYSANNLVQYAVWFDKTGTTVAPSTPGFVQIRVNISADTTAQDVATSVNNAIIAATTDFSISQATAVLTVTNANSGPSTNAAAGTLAPGGAFAASTTVAGFGEDTSKNRVRLSTYISPGQAIDDTARSLIKVINLNSSEIIYGYYLSGPTQVPGLMEFEERVLSSVTFSFQANNATVGGLFNPDITTAQSSTNEVCLNRLYFSKYQQPEAVPIVNYVDIGPKDKQIYRIIPLRDSLFILKEEAIYRLTGDIAPNFSTLLFDNSSKLIAPDTCAVLNNQIFCLTSDGVATVTETGVGIISRPIENYFRVLNSELYPNFFSASFGVTYPSAHAYYIWTVSNSADTYATQCFRYNTFTQSWTRWDKAQSCALLLTATDKMFFGSPSTNLVEVERKAFSRLDYADHEFQVSLLGNSVFNDTTMSISSVANSKEGDALVQYQYVTIDQFNSLLRKLDLDPRIGVVTFDKNYFATLALIEGGNLTSAMTALVAKLNADPGTNGGYVFSGSTNFATIQTEYNTMITAMNIDTKLKFNNYQHSTGTTPLELSINSININGNMITADFIPPFLVGPLTEYVSIHSNVVWAPVNLGDPSLLKHVKESTLLFETTDFKGATVAFSSDLSPSFESIDFSMDGNGSWGDFFWSNTTWGGQGTSVPLRTFVPRQKQRCRFIKPQFTHTDAFYKYSLMGISFAFDITSDRAYRGRK